MSEQPSLTRFAWLSILAAGLTIGLKAGAYFLTGSVGLLSDALESLVNLVAAIGALVALTVAEQDPSEEHAYGYDKAEYFSSGFEGALILLAAVGIVAAAVPRLQNPTPPTALGLGLAVSSLATVINLVVARRLEQAGRDYHSITLRADARHLMTDVWTSVGVLVGVGAVAITGWLILDPLIALLVAANIVRTGLSLLRHSALALLDQGLPRTEREEVQAVLDRRLGAAGLQWHALLTRQAGRRRFISVHVLVPGDWTVQHGHTLLEAVEDDLRGLWPMVTVFTHIEPLEDPRSFEDTTLDRVLPRSISSNPNPPAIQGPQP